jgi:hypothetical protein
VTDGFDDDGIGGGAGLETRITFDEFLCLASFQPVVSNGGSGVSID